jgi:hypothetical protein
LIKLKHAVINRAAGHEAHVGEQLAKRFVRSFLRESALSKQAA